MNTNSAYEQGNGTDSFLSPSSSPGLAVGLSLFFIFLPIIIGAIVFIYRSKIRAAVESARRGDQEKEHSFESPQVDDNPYTSMTREQPQTPIYENLGNQKPKFKNPLVEQSRSSAQSEEDLYIQCDEVDDGIYNNDPEVICKLPDPQEEDVYLMPES